MFFIQEFLNQKGLRGQLSGKNQTSGNKNFIASNYFRHQRNMYLISIGIVLCIIVLTLTRVSYIFANQHNFLLEQHKKKQMEEEQKETKENTDEVNKPKSE